MMGFLSRGISKPPVIVRSCYDPDGPPHDLRSRVLYYLGTEGLVFINESGRRAALERNGLAVKAACVVEPGIDLERFSPQREIAAEPKDFGLKSGAFVVGIVSRIRGARRLDIPLKAVHTLAGKYPHLQILVVGRGREGAVERVVMRPAQELGISDRIVLAGYCESDRLVAAFRTMDVLVYASPGSDKSCRTVREAMAAGVPVIAPEIGFLPELIADNQTGRLMDAAGNDLAGILDGLISHAVKVREMGSRALEMAAVRFSRRLQAERTLAFYQGLLRRLTS
jgi:glycosyltransferase involved in cell wall biosynthesis